MPLQSLGIGKEPNAALSMFRSGIAAGSSPDGTLVCIGRDLDNSSPIFSALVIVSSGMDPASGVYYLQTFLDYAKLSIPRSIGQ